MKRVIFIGHRDLYFGAESVMYRIIGFLKKNQLAEPLVILPKSLHSGFREQLAREGISAAALLNYKLIGGGIFRCILCLVYNIPALMLLWFSYRRKNISTVYTNTSVNILGPMLAWALNKPHIWHFHEQPTGGVHRWIPKGLFPLYQFLINRKGNLIIFISRIQKELWEKEFGFSIRNYEIIYTPAVFLPLAKTDVQQNGMVSFGFLGSFTQSKNLISLINSYARLKKQYPGLSSRLVLMGSGEHEPEIRKAIAAIQCREEIVILEHSPNVLPFFSMIDIFVLPSYFESWGLVVLEAISQKKACIVTSNTGLTEILKQDVDCIFVDPFDQGELYHAMEKLVSAPEYREQIQINSSHTLEKLRLSGRFEQSIRSLFNKEDV